MTDLQPSPQESLDQIAGDWWVFQLRKGHRFSTDDVVVAAVAAEVAPQATRVLDLGSGICSVGLMTMHLLGGFDGRRLAAVEAQELSAGLARRSLRYNKLTDVVDYRLGDLRDDTLFDEGTTFDLITGSPPYVPIGDGIISPHPQKAACRNELRGSVVDYCEAAKRWLAPGGRFAFVMLAADPRIEDGPLRHGLTVLRRTDVVFRVGREPHIAVLVCAHDEDGPHPPRVSDTITVREADGEWTPEIVALRASLGFGVEAPASPIEHAEA